MSVLRKHVHGRSPHLLEDVTPGLIEEDDVGLISMPADPLSVGGACKKQKGLFVAANCHEVTHQDPLALPHKKLYLEHLPVVDRYFKSFMYRDVINFNIITRCAF